METKMTGEATTPITLYVDNYQLEIIVYRFLEDTRYTVKPISMQNWIIRELLDAIG